MTMNGNRMRRSTLAMVLACAVFADTGTARAQAPSDGYTGPEPSVATGSYTFEGSKLRDPAASVKRGSVSEQVQASDRFISIYGGSTSGVYFFVASALCDMLRVEFSAHRVHCVARRSTGVGGNVRLFQEGLVQLAIVQSDTNFLANQVRLNQYPPGERPDPENAPQAHAEWKARRDRVHMPGAMSVMSLHDESGIMVVGPGVRIDGVADLAGMRVNLGPTDSATFGLWNETLSAHDMSPSDLGRVFNARQGFNVQSLCTGEIDAFAVWIGHPARLVQQAVLQCGAQLRGLWTDAMSNLIADKPYYYRTVIPERVYGDLTQASPVDAVYEVPGQSGLIGWIGGLFADRPRNAQQYRPGQTADLETFGFKASLVAHESVDAELVYHVVRSTIENIEAFRAANASLARVEVCDMAEEGNFLPRHPGALRYFEERGWITDDGAVTCRTAGS